MIRNARSLGMRVMVICMTEFSVGISVVAQLFPYLDYVDMDGVLLIKNEVANGPIFESGEVHVRQGCGIRIGKLLIDQAFMQKR
ncbi:MAG: hypothetical protein OXH57_03785 [Ekhidna sp.]|nr:hypothetical protein [Ekhidna sp.]